MGLRTRSSGSRAGHVAAIGVFAANADLTDAGQVVDIVLLDLPGLGKSLIGPEKTKSLGFSAAGTG